MKRPVLRIIALLLLLSLLLPSFPVVTAAPSQTEIITPASGYTKADDVKYNIVNGYVTNWGARGEDCTFLSTYANSYYTGDYTYSTLSSLDGGTTSTNAPDSDLYTALQDMMVANHTTFTKYGGTSKVDCKYFYQYTDCMLGDTSTVSTLYRGEIVSGAWDGGVSYNQEHVWPQSKCIGTSSTDIGDIMHLRAANRSENSSRQNTAYGESADFYDPGVSVRGDCARTLLYLYVRWGNTDNMWGADGVIENLEILLRWIEEDPVDTWEMGHNDAVQSITGVRNVFVDYPEYAWLLFGSQIPSNLTTPSGTSSAASQTAKLVTNISQLSEGDQIIIVAGDYEYALSTTQNTGNRAQAAITKTGSDTVSFGEDTQIITLVAGTADNSFGFQVGQEQYLYAASSSSNYLKTATTLSDNGSWSIQINDGLATITSNGTYTRNTMRYNASSGLFSCYSPTNSQKALCIYKLVTETESPSPVPESNTAALVTNYSTLKQGDRIIIVSADADYAMSTEQKTSNRGQTAITKSADGTTVTYTEDTQIITLEAGSISGSFAFRVDEGYLYASSSSSNQLKTGDTITDNASWIISSSSITAAGTNTRNTLRYNSTSGLFACYAATNTQKDVFVYRIESKYAAKPTFEVTGTSLSFEDEILYNIYFSVTNPENIVEMGLVTFAEKLSDGTIDNAIDVIPGYVTDGTEYMVQSQGIAAKNMGDALWFKVYAKLSDGSYAYSDVAGYHAVLYAKNMLGKASTTEKMKALIVAMLNYGTEAQLYFGYKTDELMNSFLTDEQKALVDSYDESMVAAVVSANSAQTAAFPKTSGTFGVSTSVSFDGAFSVNYYFTAKKSVDNGMKLYYWDASVYNSGVALTKENATKVTEMVANGSEYWAQVSGIAAKEIDQTIYVAAVYESEGVEYTSGVTAYSLGHYCKTTAAKETSAMKDFAAATAVYGYYAKQFFAK